VFRQPRAHLFSRSHEPGFRRWYGDAQTRCDFRHRQTFHIPQQDYVSHQWRDAKYLPAEQIVNLLNTQHLFLVSKLVN
jgi:hypothetical protein